MPPSVVTGIKKEKPGKNLLYLDKVLSHKLLSTSLPGTSFLKRSCKTYSYKVADSDMQQTLKKYLSTWSRDTRDFEKLHAFWVHYFKLATVYGVFGKI